MTKEELALKLNIPSYHVDEMFWDMIEVNKLLMIVNRHQVNKNDLLGDVSKQRELLIALLEWGTKEKIYLTEKTNTEIVDTYLKSNL